MRRRITCIDPYRRIVRPERVLVPPQRGERIAATPVHYRITCIDPYRRIVRPERVLVPAERGQGVAAPPVRRRALCINFCRRIVRPERVLVPAERGERIAAPPVRRRITCIDPYRRIVRPERVFVPAQRGERGALVGEKQDGGRCTPCLAASPDRRLVGLARIPRAAGQLRRRAGLCKVHHDKGQRAVRECDPHEPVDLAVGGRRVNVRVFGPVDDPVALGDNACYDGLWALFQPVAQAALVHYGSHVAGRRDVLAGRDKPSPACAPCQVKGVAPHDQFHRVVAGVGVQVRLQQVPADLLDRCRKPDRH